MVTPHKHLSQRPIYSKTKTPALTTPERIPKPLKPMVQFPTPANHYPLSPRKVRIIRIPPNCKQRGKKKTLPILHLNRPHNETPTLTLPPTLPHNPSIHQKPAPLHPAPPSPLALQPTKPSPNRKRTYPHPPLQTSPSPPSHPSFSHSTSSPYTRFISLPPLPPHPHPPPLHRSPPHPQEHNQGNPPAPDSPHDTPRL